MVNQPLPHMIKFFRKIRQRLLTKNKFSKYVFYAIGEIVLVVIGILIALQVNNWNQSRLEKEKQLIYLENLKDDISNNIMANKKNDSIFAIRHAMTAKGMQLFNNQPITKNFLLIDSLIHPRKGSFRVFKSTYDEMLNEGSFYSIENKELRDQINEYYIEARVKESAFLEFNKEIQTLEYATANNLYKLLIYRLGISPVDLNGVDTTWIQNPSSPTHLAFISRVIYLQRKGRQNMIANFIEQSQILQREIENELLQSR